MKLSLTLTTFRYLASARPTLWLSFKKIPVYYDRISTDFDSLPAKVSIYLKLSSFQLWGTLELSASSAKRLKANTSALNVINTREYDQ